MYDDIVGELQMQDLKIMLSLKKQGTGRIRWKIFAIKS